MTENGTGLPKAWERILGTQPPMFGRAGCLPAYNGEWWIFRNSQTIYEGAENAADPAKVDQLRRNAVSLLEHYPATIPQLEKLGVRVKALLNKPIETQEDVKAWAESIFNYGPIAKQPLHVRDTIDLAYDDVVIEVKSGRNPAYVIPAAPRQSGVSATLDFSSPGNKKRYGPLHAYSKAAYAKQIAQLPKRGRGRPRKDGLEPGSDEAKAANKRQEEERRERQRLREAERAARKAEKAAQPSRRPVKAVKAPPPEPVQAEPPPRRRLVHIGARKAS